MSEPGFVLDALGYRKGCFMTGVDPSRLRDDPWAIRFGTAAAGRYSVNESTGSVEIRAMRWSGDITLQAQPEVQLYRLDADGYRFVEGGEVATEWIRCPDGIPSWLVQVAVAELDRVGAEGAGPSRG